MNKRAKEGSTSNDEGLADNKKQKKLESSSLEDRLDPTSRGVHPDAIQAERAPSSRAVCVDCEKRIEKGEPRWGIKYGGNPLSEPVIPLYGSHPMVLWCHAGTCGLAFLRLDAGTMPAAARTCHACSSQPDESGLRLLCGGHPKGKASNKKIRQHAFHVQCWKRAIQNSSSLDDEGKKAILITPEEMKRKSKGGIAWNDLTETEKAAVRDEFSSA